MTRGLRITMRMCKCALSEIPCRASRGDVHLVIFLAKKYKAVYRRVPLLAICWTISISNISTNISACIDGLRFRRNVRNGDTTAYRTSTSRTESGEMCDVHLVIFLAKKYKAAYRTSTNRATYVDELPGTKPFNTAWFDAL